jgi:hypothetical protein
MNRVLFLLGRPATAKRGTIVAGAKAGGAA